MEPFGALRLRLLAEPHAVTQCLFYSKGQKHNFPTFSFTRKTLTDTGVRACKTQ